MGYAVEDEIIPGNPVSGILKRLQLEREKRITVEPMNEQEVQVFLDICSISSEPGIDPAVANQKMHSLGWNEVTVDYQLHS